MKRRTIALIVEGQGEEASLPALVARYFHHRGFDDFAPHPEPICTKTCTRIKGDYDRRDKRGIEFFIAQALRAQCDGILVLLDGDDECLSRSRDRRPALGVELLARARKVAGNTPVSVVVANRQYEGWFIAAWPTIQPELEDPSGLEVSEKERLEVEKRAGWAGKLEALLGRKYNKRLDHPVLSRHLPFDGEALRFAPSYHKLLHELDRLVRVIRKREAA